MQIKEMLDSIKKNKKGILLMMCSSIFACFGQLFWKLFENGNLLYFFGGFFFYGIGALFMIVAYRYGKLSVLQPILGMNYVIAILLGKVFLNEPVEFMKCIGIVIIVIGVILIAGGDE